MPSEKYTINVSGEEFCFTKDQLQSEPGNYFASYFFGGFQEATNGTKELQLEKDPMLFRHIQTHLRGYEIFPIPNGFMPPYMDEITALRNLKADADFFGLERLVTLVGVEIQKRSLTPPMGPERPVATSGKPDVRYRIWTHSFIERTPGYASSTVSDGASIGVRRWTDLSKEGLEPFRAKCGDRDFCLDCLKVTEGWAFVMATEMPGPKPNTPVHYVVEFPSVSQSQVWWIGVTSADSTITSYSLIVPTLKMKASDRRVRQKEELFERFSDTEILRNCFPV